MNGLRGYISSRRFRGERVPQHVQNLVVRDFCNRADMPYLLSAVEYRMPNCFMVLNQVLNELDRIGGIVMYSMFQLPDAVDESLHICDTVVRANRKLCFAVESLTIEKQSDIYRVLDILNIERTMASKATLKDIARSGEDAVPKSYRHAD